ncbi:hypothetical protein ACHAXS_005705 [Conticribra weissflogii]
MAGLGRRSHYRKHLTDAVLHDLPLPDERLGQRIARVVGTRGGNMFDVVVAPPPSLRSSSYLAPAAMSVNAAICCTDNINNEITSNEKVDITNDDIDETQLSSQTSYPLNRNQQNCPDHHHQKLTPQLAFLPTKFRKLVWIKRNDFVIVDCGDEEPTESHNVLATTESSEQPQSSAATSATNNSGAGGGGGFRYVISHILYKDQVKHIKSKGLWPDDPFFADEEPVSGSISNGVVVADEVKKILLGEKHEKGHREKNAEDSDDEEYEESEVQDYDDEDEGEEKYEDHGRGYDDNGIVFEDPMTDNFLMNTNRIANLRVDDSSSDDSDDE